MRRIQDKFSNLNISRQYRWQLRKAEAGLCTKCGRRRVMSMGLCKECGVKNSLRCKASYASKHSSTITSHSRTGKWIKIAHEMGKKLMYQL